MTEQVEEWDDGELVARKVFYAVLMGCALIIAVIVVVIFV